MTPPVATARSGGGARAGPPRGGSAAPPELLVVAAVASVQFGGALATKLFERVGPPGAMLLRLGFAAAVMLAVARPWRTPPARPGLRLAAGFGLVLASMNISFYLAIDRVPLGVAVTVEFVGPLAVAIAGSRAGLDVIWAVLAASGVGLLTAGGGAGLPLTGVLFALGAGASWGGYILLSQAVGRVYAGSSGLAVALVFATVVVLPWGLVRGGTALGSPAALGIGAAVAVLSSAIPNSLELAALRRIPVRVFGVLMSLEPGVAAIMGLLVLGQGLRPRAVAALLLVSLASLGSTLAHRRAAVPVAPAVLDPSSLGPSSLDIAGVRGDAREGPARRP